MADYWIIFIISLPWLFGLSFLPKKWKFSVNKMIWKWWDRFKFIHFRLRYGLVWFCLLPSIDLLRATKELAHQSARVDTKERMIWTERLIEWMLSLSFILSCPYSFANLNRDKRRIKPHWVWRLFGYETEQGSQTWRNLKTSFVVFGEL